jgi:hypothetical protein
VPVVSAGWWLLALAGPLGADAVAGSYNLIRPEATAVAATPRYLLAGDVTNDGLTDVVVVSPESNAVQIFRIRAGGEREVEEVVDPPHRAHRIGGQLAVVNVEERRWLAGSTGITYRF